MLPFDGVLLGRGRAPGEPACTLPAALPLVSAPLPAWPAVWAAVCPPVSPLSGAAAGWAVSAQKRLLQPFLKPAMTWPKGRVLPWRLRILS